MLLRTPLWAAHQRLGARLVEFGGWEMPVQYSGIVDEHQAVRTAAGLFDISHMGEILVWGEGALPFLNSILTNDLGKAAAGMGQYTLMCEKNGGVIDDLYVYHLEPNSYLLVVNASRIEADFTWIQQQWDAHPLRSSVQIQNASDERGAMAVQGPRVIQFIDQCFPERPLAGTKVDRPTGLKKNELACFAFGQERVWVSRTGYTGEDGFELIVPAAKTEHLWERVLELGKTFGLKPCGLGARDTLRTEMCYPLYGHELNLETTPLEAGLGIFVNFDKGPFVGREPMFEQKREGVRKKSVALTMTTRSAPPRPNYRILDGETGSAIGVVASGTQSPSLGIGIGIGFVEPDKARPGRLVQIEIRGKAAPAMIVPKPIYRPARPSQAAV